MLVKENCSQGEYINSVLKLYRSFLYSSLMGAFKLTVASDVIARSIIPTFRNHRIDQSDLSRKRFFEV